MIYPGQGNLWLPVLGQALAFTKAIFAECDLVVIALAVFNATNKINTTIQVFIFTPLKSVDYDFILFMSRTALNSASPISKYSGTIKLIERFFKSTM